MNKITVLGMDPSLRNWGLVLGNLDLDTGSFDIKAMQLVQPENLKGKQVRNNSNDLHLARHLVDSMSALTNMAQVIFVEVPIGSQSARAMASYGICIGILGALQATGKQVIEVTPTEVKVAMTGNKNATKQQMIAAATSAYGGASWPMYKNAYTAKCEHLADAVGAIHAGTRTPVFQSLIQLLKGTK